MLSCPRSAKTIVIESAINGSIYLAFSRRGTNFIVKDCTAFYTHSVLTFRRFFDIGENQSIHQSVNQQVSRSFMNGAVNNPFKSPLHHAPSSTSVDLHQQKFLKPLRVSWFNRKYASLVCMFCISVTYIFLRHVIVTLRNSCRLHCIECKS